MAVSHGDGSRPSRWSGDGWVLLRGQADRASLAAGSGAYGGSQAGAVLRFALAPGSRLKPAAYARLTSAVGGFTDRQLALGLSVRPMRRQPVALLAEVRVQQGSAATQVRPALALVGGLGPRPVGAPGLGLELEGFGQAGWVGGRDATAFFDLQGTVLHRLVRLNERGDLSLGAGAWSGGQQGAVRLDVGPRVQWRIAPGGLRMRAMLDWRFRVAGSALPGSGPVLTLAGGF
ncbi:hypothetical protein [Novosphingobium sp.]|uniref:hypothetical protein n=1 Tax=Novosphingobium sp. TaxID=1874826 RepID=UPI0038BB3CD7